MLKKLFASFKDKNTVGGLEKKIIKNHKDITSIKNELSKVKFGNKKSVLQEKLGKLSKEKERLEDELLKLINKDCLYLGLSADFDNLKNGLELKLVKWEDVSNHCLVLGTTRVGKTKLMLNIIKQNILRGDNIIVCDPKNGIDLEVFNKMIEFADNANRIDEFLYVNPFMPNATEYFNPIFNMSDDEVASLISSILYPGEDSDSKFYSGHAETILKALLYALSYLEMNTDPKKELKTQIIKEQWHIYEMIKTKNLKIDENNSKDVFDKIETQIINKELGTIPIFNRSFLTFRDILFYLDKEKIKLLKTSCESIPPIDEKTASLRSQVLIQIDKFLLLPDEFNSKISLALVNFLSSLSIGSLGDMLCTIKINPIAARLFNNEKGLILLMHPVPMIAKKTSEHLVKVILKSLESIYGGVSLTGRAVNNRRLYIHLDEGESALYKGAESILNKGAGLGQTMLIYTQSDADLSHKLGETLAKVSKDSLNTTFIFKMNDVSSKEKVVEMFGQKYIMESNVMYREGASATSFSNTKKNYLTTSSIDKLGVGECFFINKDSKNKLFLPFISGVDTERCLVVTDLRDEEKITKMLVDLENRNLGV
ncbi:hypothetical protein CQA57_05730 [Helicobacter anseris]|uniref:TraD/TraG TraM recognition site domain-containing protein n=1 Tax=Helicobacter anseris TaxID=375926 RepID=A0A3D8J755_9HELI|nr:type IV secretion system DNA-binding domain-containing protein [Helicobacter anseris]RDU73025.1 hypothetical protein CQA57_05730 [Helicobacter anseris]